MRDIIIDKAPVFAQGEPLIGLESSLPFYQGHNTDSTGFGTQQKVILICFFFKNLLYVLSYPHIDLHHSPTLQRLRILEDLQRITLKVHKIEICFGFDFEICIISLLVMSKC